MDRLQYNQPAHRWIESLLVPTEPAKIRSILGQLYPPPPQDDHGRLVQTRGPGCFTSEAPRDIGNGIYSVLILSAYAFCVFSVS
ncbi:hypothetical protein AB205_0071900 [Aquarana catesbeiana]|uniref:Uncharacterized protein n=1 Tax=Aquarana catesbeiana TaxID=8400 RepID=A0A2G9QKJ8_AQUCT|nr:hypothetical protein AB205_0071900 [Aquarana catesbeiana]